MRLRLLSYGTSLVQTNGRIKYFYFYWEPPEPTRGVRFVKEKVRLRHARHSHIYIYIYIFLVHFLFTNMSMHEYGYGKFVEVDPWE